MKFYEATTTIKASPEVIWTILTDGPGYSRWDSGVIRVDGSIAPGQKIKVVSEANPKRAFPVKVTEFVPGRRVTVREEYTGPFLPMIWKSMPDLQPSFDKFTTGLRAKAEKGGD